MAQTLTKQQLIQKYSTGSTPAPSNTGAKQTVSKADLIAKYKNPTTPPAPEKNAYTKDFADPARNVVEGFAKGEGSTVMGLGKVGSTVLNQTVGRFVNLFSGKGFKPTEAPPEYTTGTPQEKKISEALAPKGAAQNIGYYGEKAAEFMTPSGMVKKGQVAVDAALEGGGILNATGRVLGKAAIEGLSTGAVATAQSGSFKEGAKTGLVAGGIKTATGALGEIAKAYNIPEKLYSKIFKNSYRDMIDQLKTEVNSDLQTSDPERFQKYVDAGIIKVDKGGAAIVDDTVARQALDRGLKGSLDTMTKKVVLDTYDNEIAARAAAKSATETVKVPEEQFSKIFKRIATDYEDVGFGDLSTKAQELSDKFAKGEISAEDALDGRRLLDSARIQSSYNTNAHVSLGQQNLKFLSNVLRGRLNAVNGIGDIMKDYSFNIDALEALAKEATREGNKQAIGWIEAALFGGGAITGNLPASAAAAALKRMTTFPTVLTGGAQMIEKGISSPVGIGLKALLSKQISNSGQNPQQQ